MKYNSAKKIEKDMIRLIKDLEKDFTEKISKTQFDKCKERARDVFATTQGRADGEIFTMLLSEVQEIIWGEF